MVSPNTPLPPASTLDPEWATGSQKQCHCTVPLKKQLVAMLCVLELASGASAV